MRVRASDSARVRVKSSVRAKARARERNRERKSEGVCERARQKARGGTRTHARTRARAHTHTHTHTHTHRSHQVARGLAWPSMYASEFETARAGKSQEICETCQPLIFVAYLPTAHMPIQGSTPLSSTCLSFASRNSHTTANTNKAQKQEKTKAQTQKDTDTDTDTDKDNNRHRIQTQKHTHTRTITPTRTDIPLTRVDTTHPTMDPHAHKHEGTSTILTQSRLARTIDCLVGLGLRLYAPSCISFGATIIFFLSRSIHRLCNQDTNFLSFY